MTSWRSKDKQPQTKYPGVKDSKHQEMLRGFEMKFGRTGAKGSLDGRWSVFSGVSPMASRVGSVDLRRVSRGEEVVEAEDTAE